IVVEDDDRMLSAVESEDPVARVRRDAGDLNKAPPRRQLTPAFANFEAWHTARRRNRAHLSNTRARTPTLPRPWPGDPAGRDPGHPRRTGHSRAGHTDSGRNATGSGP